MPRIAANPPHARVPRGDGRELVVFESIVALLLIISGFSLYIGKAFTAPDAPVSGGAVGSAHKRPPKFRSVSRKPKSRGP